MLILKNDLIVHQKRYKEIYSKYSKFTMFGTLYYYKGTTMPQMWLKEDDSYKLSKEMIVLGLRDNVSLTEQSQIYFEQLNKIEEAMYKYCNPTSKEGMNRVSEMLNESEEKIYTTWCLNICALLIMKVLPNDEMNGLLTSIEKDEKTVIFKMF